MNERNNQFFFILICSLFKNLVLTWLTTKFLKAELICQTRSDSEVFRKSLLFANLLFFLRLCCQTTYKAAYKAKILTTKHKSMNTFHLKLSNTIKWLALFSICFQLNCTHQKSDLEGTWILVHQELLPESDGMSKLEGMLLHFDEKTLKRAYGPSRFNREERYFIEDNYIKTDSFIIGKIQHLSKDSLVLLRETEGFLMEFYPLQETSFRQKDYNYIEKQLVAAPWEFQIEDYYYRLYCDTSIWMPQNDSWIKSIYYESNDNYLLETFSMCEKWTLYLFENKIFFYYSVGQLEFNIIQITNYNENTFYGKLFRSYFREIKIDDVVLNSFKTNKYNDFKITRNDIIGEWKASTMNQNEDILDIKMIENEEDKRNFLIDYTNKIHEYKLRYSGRISVSDIKGDNLSYYFKENGEYEIKAGQKTIRKGNNWYLFSHNRFIVLDNHYNGNNFIKITGFGNEKLSLKKLEYIDVEQENPDMCFHTYLTLHLQKQ